MLDEGETIGTDGTQTHGPNSVISMIHHALESSGFGEMACVLHADNCGGKYSGSINNFLSITNQFLFFAYNNLSSLRTAF